MTSLRFGRQRKNFECFRGSDRGDKLIGWLVVFLVFDIAWWTVELCMFDQIP